MAELREGGRAVRVREQRGGFEISPPVPSPFRVSCGAGMSVSSVVSTGGRTRCTLECRCPAKVEGVACWSDAKFNAGKSYRMTVPVPQVIVSDARPAPARFWAAFLVPPA